MGDGDSWIPTPWFEPEYVQRIAEVAGIDPRGVVLPASRQVVVGRTRLHLLDWGSAVGPAILFLHAGGLSARSWDPICLALSSGWRCVALDQRGHGDSEWSPECDYSMAASDRDLEGVIEALGLEEPVLVGHSMGAVNALHFAAGHGDTAGLALLDIGFRTPRQETETLRDQSTARPTRDRAEDFIPASWRGERAADPLFRTLAAAGIRRRPDGRWMRKADLRLQGMDDFLERIDGRQRMFLDLAGRLRCPTLIVRGARSTLLSADDAAALAGAAGGPATVIEAGSGHFVPTDDPRGTIAGLRSLLSGV